MTSTNINCGKCKKLLPKNLRVVNCDTCKRFYHVKCCGVTHKEFNLLRSSNSQWHCQACTTSALSSSLNAKSNTEEYVKDSHPDKNQKNPVGRLNVGTDSLNVTCIADNENNNLNDNVSITAKGTECGICLKKMPSHLRLINCDKCKQFFHVKCCGVIHKEFNLIKEL